MHARCTWWPEEGTGSLRTRAIDGSKSYECWELNPGLLGEHPAFVSLCHLSRPQKLLIHESSLLFHFMGDLS